MVKTSFTKKHVTQGTFSKLKTETPGGISTRPVFFLKDEG
jgi:hypothetical protein